MGGLVHMIYGSRLARPTRDLPADTSAARHKTVKNAGYSVGNLTPNPNSFTNEILDIDALSDAHVPTLET